MPTILRLKDLENKRKEEKINNSIKYYNSPQWKRFRENFIRKHPLCEVCLEKGKVVEAQQVHHVTQFLKGIDDKQRWKLLLDEDNCISICKQCHIEIHKQMRQKNVSS